MRKHLKSSLLLTTLLLAIGCEKTQTLNFTNSLSGTEFTHTLEKVDEYEIPVDSVTATNVLHYQYYEQDGIEYFTMLNKITQEINFYDLNKRTLAFKIPLLYEGPNSVGNLDGFNAGYHIHTLDSIFVFNRSQFELYLIDRNSTIVNVYYTNREFNVPSPVVAPFAPMTVHHDKAILANFQNAIEYQKRNKTYLSEYATILDLKSQKVDYFLSYPDNFKKGAWGFDLHRISWAFDDINQRIIVSFALDDHLYSFDYNGNLIEKIFAPSKIVKEARSITKDEYHSSEGSKNYYFSQDKFGQIFFDPLRKVILRDCIAGVSIEDLKSGKTTKTKRNLILIDYSSKEKIGEVMENLGGLLILFFTEEGIHKLAQTNNEDVLKFEVYQYKSLSGNS